MEGQVFDANYSEVIFFYVNQMSAPEEVFG